MKVTFDRDMTVKQDQGKKWIPNGRYKIKLDDGSEIFVPEELTVKAFKDWIEEQRNEKEV